MTWPQIGSTLGGLIVAHGLELILIRWVLLSRDRQPQASIAWILTILFVPFLGGFLFLMFGVNNITRRREERADNVEELSDREARLPEAARVDLSTWTPRGRRAAEALGRLCDTRPTRGNRVEVMHDTNRTLGLIEQAIRDAEHHIHLEYYIWESDETGRRLRDLLVERAKDGVEVRFLYDSIGSLFLKSQFLRPMTEAGVEVRTFLPGQTFRERWSLNNRSHRKIVVVDGKAGFTGGMNIGNEYLGLIKTSGRWRDCHLRVEGPAALQLQRVFRDDWYYATNVDLDESYFPTPTLFEESHVVQVVAGGPDQDPRPFHQLLFMAITEAERSLTLTTGYFIPTDSLAMALSAAAIRGVDVRILVPGRTPHFFKTTIWAGRSYYDKLLQSGCKIHEYTDGTLHAKTLTVDGLWSLVGSANFDARSTLLNFEVGCVIYGAEVAEDLRRQYELDCRQSSPVTLAEREAIAPRHRFVENFSRLFTPIL